MSGAGPRAATTNKEPLSSSGTRQPFPYQSTVSSNTEGKPRTIGKPRPIDECRKKPSAECSRKKPAARSILVAVTTSRSSSKTTTTTKTAFVSSQPSPTTRSKTTTTKFPTAVILSPVSTPTVSRIPLQIRDKNAAPSRPTGPLKSPLSAAMSANKKPVRQIQTPGLSAPAARGLGKPPLTPKIATRGTIPVPGAQQTASVVTPLSIGRRAQQRSDPSPGNNGRDDIASPMNTFLANTVTPRSGPRQSRKEATSANSTPTGTPNTEDHDTWDTRSGAFSMSPIPVVHGDSLRRPGLTVTLSQDTHMGSGVMRQDKDIDSKFFYASEASKSTTTPQTTQPPRQQQLKADTFFYANGATLPETRQNATSTASPPVLASPPVQQDNLMSKFVYANEGRDAPAAPAARPSVASRKSTSVVSTASKAPAPRLGTPTILGNMPGHLQQRPVSPVKAASYAPATKNTCTQSLPMSRTSSGLGAVPTLGPAPVIQKRRSIPSADAARPPSVRGGHSRQGSVTTIAEAQPPTVARFIPSVIPSQPPSRASSPSNLSNSGLPTPGLPSPLPTAAGGFPSLLQATEDLAVTDQAPADEDPTAAAGLDSPTKLSSQDQALADLVTTARRERKVQDLEITNASLEAINRTLERQLRKQTAELRRHKRMSRVSRLSFNPLEHLDGRGSRVVSADSVALGALARAGLSLGDLSEEELSDVEADEMAEMDDEMSDEDDLSPLPSESEEMSPGARALRDAKHRRRDEQRLQLDLAKHQQLLVDSQKMNQSLRRCLGWTEELIQEGRRALAYTVHVSEIELGGRVLAPEEVEGRDQSDEDSHVEDERGAVVLPAVRSDLEGAASQEGWAKTPQDRDSGIDLPGDGS